MWKGAWGSAGQIQDSYLGDLIELILSLCLAWIVVLLGIFGSIVLCLKFIKYFV